MSPHLCFNWPGCLCQKKWITGIKSSALQPVALSSSRWVKPEQQQLLQLRVWRAVCLCPCLTSCTEGMAGERQGCRNTFPAGAADPYGALCEGGWKPRQDTLVEQRTHPVKCKPQESGQAPSSRWKDSAPGYTVPFFSGMGSSVYCPGHLAG